MVPGVRSGVILRRLQVRDPMGPFEFIAPWQRGTTACRPSWCGRFHQTATMRLRMSESMRSQR